MTMRPKRERKMNLAISWQLETNEVVEYLAKKETDCRLTDNIKMSKRTDSRFQAGNYETSSLQRALFMPLSLYRSFSPSISPGLVSLHLLWNSSISRRMSRYLFGRPVAHFIAKWSMRCDWLTSISSHSLFHMNYDFYSLQSLSRSFTYHICNPLFCVDFSCFPIWHSLSLIHSLSLSYHHFSHFGSHTLNSADIYTNSHSLLVNFKWFRWLRIYKLV